MNEQVRVEEGTAGTIVVIAAWCERCGKESQPHSYHGTCGFCGSQIVDYDTLNARELRRQLDGPPVRVAAREHVGVPVPAVRTEPLLAPPAVVPIRAGLEVPTLAIADGFSLPVDVAGEATAILAKRGAGKTNTGRVLAEEYVRAGVQLAVVDPVGVWWGLRSSADGEHDGLAVPVLGGEHGDLPLAAWTGALTAHTMVETGASFILDLSDFSKEEQHGFVADFAEELFLLKRRARGLIHVMLEEADEFAPQRGRGLGDADDVARMKKSVEQLARRGRSSGIGLTFITQRSAALSKDVLTQADTLIAMRTTGPTDVKAIQEWVTRNADGGDQVVRSLASLKTGEAWVWSPERETLARVQIRLAWTFDSSSTPKFGEERVEPHRRSSVALPLALDRPPEPEPDLDADFRLIDADGRFGCKIDGCTNRSLHNAGPKAFRCPDHGGPPLILVDGPEAEDVDSGGAAVPLPPAAVPSQKPEPLTVDGTTLFGLTGHFARDAARVRDEADRIRAQADALEQIAEQLDTLAVLQENL